MDRIGELVSVGRESWIWLWVLRETLCNRCVGSREGYEGIPEPTEFLLQKVASHTLEARH